MHKIYCGTIEGALSYDGGHLQATTTEGWGGSVRHQGYDTAQNKGMVGAAVQHSMWINRATRQG